MVGESSAFTTPKEIWVFGYRMRANISRGFYIFYPIFKDHFFVFKEVFSETSVPMYGLYSRAAYDGARTVSYDLSQNKRFGKD